MGLSCRVELLHSHWLLVVWWLLLVVEGGCRLSWVLRSWNVVLTERLLIVLEAGRSRAFLGQSLIWCAQMIRRRWQVWIVGQTLFLWFLGHGYLLNLGRLDYDLLTWGCLWWKLLVVIVLFVTLDDVFEITVWIWHSVDEKWVLRWRATFCIGINLLRLFGLLTCISLIFLSWSSHTQWSFPFTLRFTGFA